MRGVVRCQSDIIPPANAIDAHASDAAGHRLDAPEGDGSQLLQTLSLLGFLERTARFLHLHELLHLSAPARAPVLSGFLLFAVRIIFERCPSRGSSQSKV